MLRDGSARSSCSRFAMHNSSTAMVRSDFERGSGEARAGKIERVTRHETDDAESQQARDG
eukprot:6179271-Pleurochrysis_carterae.AAC.7